MPKAEIKGRLAFTKATSEIAGSIRVSLDGQETDVALAATDVLGNKTKVVFSRGGEELLRFSSDTDQAELTDAQHGLLAVFGGLEGPIRALLTQRMSFERLYPKAVATEQHLGAVVSVEQPFQLEADVSDEAARHLSALVSA